MKTWIINYWTRWEKKDEDEEKGIDTVNNRTEAIELINHYEETMSTQKHVTKYK